MSAPSKCSRLHLPFILLLLTLLSGFGWIVRAGADDAVGTIGFDVLTFQRLGVVLLATSGDMNGDGETDLLLLSKPARESYEKICAVYFRRDGRLPDKPDIEVSLGESPSAVAVHDIDSDGVDELCGFDSRGMVVFRLDSESSTAGTRLIEFQTLLPKAGRRLMAADWVADVNSDGSADVVLPAIDGLHLFTREGPDVFKESRTFQTPINGAVRRESDQAYISYRLPKIAFADYDKDGNIDIGAFDIEQMNFYLTDGSKMPHLQRISPLVREFTKDFIGASSFEDLNADGMPDAVVVLMSQKKSLQSEVRIYFCGENMSYGTEPANVYSGDARLIFPMFLDANGDGKKELLLQDIDVGFSFFLNYFLANRIKADMELRVLTPEGRYSDEPEIRRAIYVKVSESGAEPGRCVGDFNGDGLDDLVVAVNEERLVFFLSNKKDIITRKPDFEIPAPAYGKISEMDLDSDGRSDLVILYTERGKEGIATVLLSK